MSSSPFSPSLFAPIIDIDGITIDHLERERRAAQQSQERLIRFVTQITHRMETMFNDMSNAPTVAPPKAPMQPDPS